MPSLKASNVREMTPLTVWGVLTLFTLAALAVSIFAVMLAEGNKVAHWHLIIASSVGTLSAFGCFWLFLFLSRRKWSVRILEPIPSSTASLQVFAVALLLSVALCLLTETDRPHILKEHGGIFELIFAVFTVVGLWLTYDSILEVRRVITSFQDLYTRMSELIKDSTKNPHHGKVRILAYTPAIGFLALPNEKWTRLKADLTAVRDRLEVICLDHDDLTYWHNQYIGRQTWRVPEDGGPKLTIRDTLLATVESDDVVNDSAVRPRSGRKKLEMMPGFYLIFNDVKAIVVTPFFIPFPIGTPTAAQQQPQDRVQMLGFETTDGRIIDDVKQFFQLYKTTVPDKPLQFDTQIGDLSQISERLMKQIESLKASSLEAGTILRYRLSVVKAADWEDPNAPKKVVSAGAAGSTGLANP
jgi:hypothetical protein